MTSSRTIKRRDVLRLGGAGAAIALGGGLVLPSIALAQPKRGGVLRLAFDSGSASDTLDPAVVGQSFKVTLSYGTLRNNLTEVAANGDLVPELAESWEATPDAKTWAFKIRKGVEFHNGKTLTPQDVIASFNHHRGKKTKSGAKALLKQIEDVRIDGDMIIFSLKSGIADFAWYLSNHSLQICPVIGGKLDVLSGIGTGAYVLQEFEPGVRASGTRNPNYFKTDRAFFDEVRYRSIPDSTARTNALLTGEVDVVVPADIQTIDLLARRDNIEIFSVVTRSHQVFPMRNTDAPFDNNDVRLAFKHAFDKKTHVERIMRGYGEVGNHQPIAKTDPFYAEGLEDLGYDIDKAKFHLRKAGLSTVNVKLHSAEGLYPGAIDACSLFRESAAPAGINVEVVREHRDGYFANVWRKRPFVASFWRARPTADMLLTTVYAEGAPYNETVWSHERFNTLLVEARSMLDFAGRKERYAEIQRIIRDEGPTIIPAFTHYVGASSNKLAHGPHIGSNNTSDNGRLCERWWFA